MGLSPQASLPVLRSTLAAYDQETATRQQLQENELTLARKKVDLETSIAQLDRIRRESAREREDLQSIASLQSQFNEANKETDPLKRRKSVESIVMSNAATAASNPAVNSYLTRIEQFTRIPEQKAPELSVAQYSLKGGDPNLLRAYGNEFQKQIGRPLVESDPIPAEVFAAGIRKPEAEEKAKPSPTALKVLDQLDSIKVKPAEFTGGQQLPARLEDPTSIQVVDVVVDIFGTKDEKSSYGSKSEIDKVNIARKISTELRLGKRAGLGGVAAPAAAAAAGPSPTLKGFLE